MKNTELTHNDVPHALEEVRQIVRQMRVILGERNERPYTEDLMTVDGAAQLLGLTKSGIYSKVHKRQIPFIKLQHSSRVRFSRKQLTAWLMEGQRQAA